MSNKLRAMLEAQRKAAAQRAEQQSAPVPAPISAPTSPKTPVAEAVAEAVAPTMLGKGAITFDMLNEQQRKAVTMFARPITNGNTGSFVLDGPAGTGKTTTTRLGIQAALEAGVISRFPLPSTSEDSLPPEKQYPTVEGDSAGLGASDVLRRGAPRIVIVSYTNVAVRNIKEIVPNEIKPHTTTMHKLLNYYPEDITREVIENGLPVEKTSQQFIPRFGREPLVDGGRGLGAGMKLPHLDVVVIEEAGTVPVWLFKTLVSALPFPEKTRFVFLGDIEQLDPAFGTGILGYKTVELPCVNLVETYRNIGLITKFAHRILSGKPIGPLEAKSWNQSDDSGTIKMMPFVKAMDADRACSIFGQYLRKQIVAGAYHESTDIVLIPFNVQFGTIELNRHIMQGIAERDDLKIYEVIAGRENFYLFIGARVMVNKQYYIIEKIEPNDDYTGTTKPFPPSHFIDCWGRRRAPRRNDPVDMQRFEEEQAALDEAASSHVKAATAMEDVTKMLEAMYVKDAQTSTQSSAILTLKAVNSDGSSLAAEDALGIPLTVTIKSSSDLNSILLPYALTVYKAQGSEFQNVTLVMHQSHSVGLAREVLYTAVTRARRNLTFFYSDVSTTKSTTHDVLTKSIVRQNIPGRNRQEKLEFFRRKILEAARRDALAGTLDDNDMAMVHNAESVVEAAMRGTPVLEQNMPF